MTRSLFILTAAVVALASAAGVAQDRGEGEREIRHRTWVLERGARRAEVRILGQGDSAAIQSVLLTRLLRRAQREIEERETRHWSDDPDSQRYLEALRSTLQQARDLRAEPGNEERYGVFLEFSLVPRPHATLAVVPIQVRKDEIVVDGEALQSQELELREDYVRTNLGLIVMEVWEIGPEEAQQLLDG